MFPQLSYHYSTDEKLLSGIKSGELYGFIKCDVESPKEFIDKYLHLNFDAHNVCDEDELFCSKQFQRTNMIRDFAYFPVHPRAVKQYRIQKVLAEDFDLVKYIKSICDYISGTYLVALDLVYFVMKPTKLEESIR
jgi:hypothetical protein